MFQSRIEPFTNSATFPKIFHDRPALTSLTNKQKKKEAHRRGKKNEELIFGLFVYLQVRRKETSAVSAKRKFDFRVCDTTALSRPDDDFFVRTKAEEKITFPSGPFSLLPRPDVRIFRSAGGHRLFREMRVTFRALPLAICFGVSHAKWIREDNKTKA